MPIFRAARVFGRGALLGACLVLAGPALGARAASPAAESPATAALSGSAVAELVRSVLRLDAQPDRELRKLESAALRIFTNGDGLLPPALPSDVWYLVVATQAGEELLGRGAATIAERAQLVRLLSSLALGATRPAAELREALRSEAEIGEPGGFIRRRAAAIAQELPKIARAATEDARRHAAIVLDAVPSHPATLRALGELELRVGDGARATALLEQAAARAEDDAEARLLLGEARLTTGREDEAKAALDAAVAADPLLRSRAVQALRDASGLAELAALDARVGERPLTPEEGLERIDLLLGLGRIEDAVAGMRALLRAIPDDPTVRRRAAQVYVATLHLADWQALTLMGEPPTGGELDDLEVRLVGTYMQLNDATIAAAASGAGQSDRTTRARERFDEVLDAYAERRPEAAAVARVVADALAMAAMPPGGPERPALAHRLAARVVEEQPRSAIARRVGSVLLLTAGELEAAARFARDGLSATPEAERAPYALFTAQVQVTLGARIGVPEALVTALELLEPLLDQPEPEEGCPGGCFDRGLAWATRAAALDALALLGDEDQRASRLSEAEEAGARALPLLRTADPHQARIAASILYNRAYRALVGGDADAARVAVERARRVLPISPQGDLYAALLAVLERDFVPARDLLSHGLLLGPNSMLSLTIRKWALLVADRMASREDFVAQLRALHALYTEAVPEGRPGGLESMSLAGSASAKIGYGTTSGFFLQATVDQALTLLESQPALNREKVARLKEQVEAALGGDAAEEGARD